MKRMPAAKRSDTIAGLIAIAIGTFIILEARSYDLGTLRDMGPGYFPILLGAIMTAMGVLLLLLRDADASRAADMLGTVRGTLLLGAAFLAFALLIERAGLVPSAFLTTFLAGLGDRRTDWRAAAALAAVTALAAWVIFNLLLGLQIEAIRT